jgi:signal transduction histidine kinase
MNATGEASVVLESLRLPGSASGAPDVDQLHEICHDMRQPVASILALADAVLTTATIPSAVRDRLGQVQDQAEWLAELLRQLIEPQGERPADRESHNLIHLASNAVQMEMVTYSGDLVFKWDDCNVRVLGDRVEIRRAIANLLGNATRAAGPDGRVIVGLRRANDRVLLTVDDSGPGFGLIRRGIGLGLQVVTRSLNSFGGDLEYRRSQLGGVQAILSLRAVNCSA